MFLIRTLSSGPPVLKWSKSTPKMGKMSFLMSFSDFSWNFRSNMCLPEKFFEFFHLAPNFQQRRVPREILNFHKEIYENFIVWKIDFWGKIGKMSEGCVGKDQKLCKNYFYKVSDHSRHIPHSFSQFFMKNPIYTL